MHALIRKFLLLTVCSPLILSAEVVTDLGNFFPMDMSADGSVVVGRDGFNGQIAKWENGEVELLGMDSNVTTVAVSGDGTTIITEYEKWVNGQVSPIIELTGDRYFYASDISSDGSTIVGNLFEYPYGVEGQMFESGARVVNGALQKLNTPGVPEIHSGPVVHTVSANGNSVVGIVATLGSTQRNVIHPIKWTGNVPTTLPTLALGGPPYVGSRVHKISDDGSTAVGVTHVLVVNTHYVDHPVMWRDNSVVQLTTYDGKHHRIAGVSADGSVIAGSQSGKAFIWTEATGLRDLKEMLAENPDLDLTGQSFDDAQALSSDGRMVAGFTYNSAQNSYAGWLVKVPPIVKVEIILPKPYFQVDEPFEATVKISSTEPEPVTFSFPNGVLTALDEEFLELTVEEAEPFVLSSEEPERVFIAQVIPRKLGTGKLTTAVEAIIGGGLKTLTSTVNVTVPPLHISLRALPLIEEKPIINMELTEVEGAIIVTDEAGNAIEPKIEVTIKNLSDASVDVLLQGLDPRARDKSELPGRIATVGAFPMELGTLAAGAEVKREIPLQINNDGRFEFSALATGVFTGTDAQFNMTFAGAPIAVGQPYPVELEIEFVRTPVITNQNNGAFFLQPGGSLQIVAAVYNRTSNSTLKFFGVRAEKRLNALGAHLTSVEGNLADPPHVHDHEVDAASSVVLGGRILTDPEGAPSGTVKWEGLKDAVLVDDETEEETELTADDVLVRNEAGGWLGNEMMLRIIQDFSRPSAPPSLTVGEQVAVYSYGAMLGMGEWTYDTFDAIGGIGRFAGTISADPSLLADAWGEASRAVWEAAEMAANTWAEMSSAEREEFIENFVGEVQRRLLLFTVTRSPVDANDAEAVRSWLTAATYSLFGGLENAYASDDPALIAQEWGRVSGHAGMEVVTAALPSPQFTKYIPAAELNKLTANNALGPALTDQESLLRAIYSGPLGRETSLRAFGVGSADIDDFQDVFTAFGVKGYARERAPISYNLINELGEAVWKPELMKPKGFNDLDLLVLGDPVPMLPGKPPTNRSIDLKGITGIFWPQSDDVIRTRLASAGESEEVIKAALSRAALRREEFAKYYPEFKAWQQDGLPVAKNYKDNGVPDPTGEVDTIRAFDFDSIDHGEAGTLHIARMANEAGEMRYISGDIDWIHFSFLDGSPLDPDTARKLYDALCRCCGMQHPETVSWIRDGQTVFKAKAGQIGEYFRGQKALFELSENGPRAVRVSGNLTRFAADGRGHLIFFDNGIKSRLRSTAADIETAFAKYQHLYPRRVILPFLWLAKGTGAGEEGTIDGQEWSFTTEGGDELLLRQGESGSIEQFDGSSWVEWNTVAPAFAKSFQASASPQLGLTPTTSLASPARAGETTLVINDLPAQWTELLEGRVQNWFEPGQTIVIAPGELHQETHTLLSSSPFVTSAPLQNDHPLGTVVAVVPATMLIEDVSPTASKLLSTIENEDGSTSQIWSSRPGRLYALEFADGSPSGEWSVLLPNIQSDDVVLAINLPAGGSQDEFTYRLRDLSSTPDPLAIESISVDPVTRTATVHWHSQLGKSYLIDTSENLQTHSWSTVMPEVSATGTLTSAVLPFEPQSETGFFRVRESDPGSGLIGGSSRNISMTLDNDAMALTISWQTAVGETYVLETANVADGLEWSADTDPIEGTGDLITLIIPLGDASQQHLFRVVTRP